jgi:lipopolysaccharide exporter
VNVSNLIKGSSLLIFDSLITKLIGLVSTLILARVLTPEDFGIVAITVVVGIFFETLGTLGMNEYIVCHRRPGRNVLNTAFTLNLMIRTVIASVFFVLANDLANYFDEPRLKEMFQFYCLIIFLSGIENPAHFLLKRKQQYVNIIKVTILAKIVAVGVAVYVAMAYQSYWALLLGTFTDIIIRAIGSYVIYPYRPRLSSHNLKTQWDFSKWLIPQALVGYGRIHLDTFIASAHFGKQYLGAYNTMKYIAIIPNLNIITPITATLLAQLSHIMDNQVHFESRLKSAFVMTCLIALPIAIFVYFNNNEIIFILLGEQWVEYSNLFRYLILILISNVFLTTARRLFVLHQNTKPLLAFEIVTSLIVIGPLFFYDFANIYTFVAYKVISELALCFLFFIYGTSKYVTFRNTLNMTAMFVSVLMCTLLAQLLSAEVVLDYVLLQLMVTFSLFASVFILSFGLVLKLSSPYSPAMNYIYTIILKRFDALTDKIGNVNGGTS